MKKSVCAFCCMFFIGIASGAIIPDVMISVDGHVFTDPYPTRMASMPIEGVKVYLQPQLMILMKQGAIFPGYTVDSTTTDASGYFAFKQVSAASYNLSLQHKSYETRNVALTATEDTTLRLSLLARGAHGQIAGVVTIGAVATPYAPALLVPLQQCTVTVWIDPAYYYPLPVVDLPVTPERMASYTAVTDKNGVYSIDSIPISYNNTRAYVTASKTGFTPQSVDTGVWNTMTTKVNFTLIPSTNPATRDTVTVIPANPTTRDSITFIFYDADACCCAVFVNPSVIVSDTMVMLSYALNTDPCALCMCIAPGVRQTFRSGPLKAGKYGIYSAASIYCPPPRICPMIAIMPVRVGEFVVKPPVLSVRPAALESKLGSGFTLSQEKNTVTLFGSCANPEKVTVQVFNSRGILIGEMAGEQSAPGSFRSSWTAGARGVYLLSVKADGVLLSSHRVVIHR